MLWRLERDMGVEPKYNARETALLRGLSFFYDHATTNFCRARFIRPLGAD